VKTLALDRVRQNDFATYGRLYDETGAQIAVTLEPPKSGVHPCIPAGIYPLRRRGSKKHGCEVFGVEEPWIETCELDPLTGALRIRIGGDFSD